MPLSDASLPLQKALVAWLKNDPAVAAVVNGRVFDAVPPSAAKPYVSVGPFQVIPENAECSEGGEIFVTLDGWATGPDQVMIKRLGAAIAALHGADLALDENQRLVDLRLESLNYLRDPDGITTHAAVTLRALTEPVEP